MHNRNIISDRPLRGWTKHRHPELGSDRYLYKRYISPSWKRGGESIITVAHASYFDRTLFNDCKVNYNGFGYQIKTMGVYGPEVRIEEIFSKGETLFGVMFYADLKALEVGYIITEPFIVSECVKNEPLED